MKHTSDAENKHKTERKSKTQRRRRKSEKRLHQEGRRSKKSGRKKMDICIARKRKEFFQYRDTNKGDMIKQNINIICFVVCYIFIFGAKLYRDLSLVER